MDKDEILRLKQITGLASLFKDVKFGQAWKPVEDDLEEPLSPDPPADIDRTDSGFD
jgi:hypothetical protein